MRCRFLIGLFAAAALASTAVAQELGPGSAGFGFTLALTEYQIRDAVLNPIRHRGTSLSLELFRRGGGKEVRHRLGVSVLFDPLGDRYTTGRSSTLVRLEVDLRLGRKVTEIGAGTSVFVGGRAGWSTHFEFHEQWDQQHVYWLTAAEVGPVVALERRLGGGRSIQADAAMPVLALVSRPPERFGYREVDHGLGWMLGEIHSAPRLATPGEHLALRGGLTYSAVRDGRLRHAFFWRATWIRNDAPASREVSIVSHSLGVSMPCPF
jgi:hypothetical protein